MSLLSKIKISEETKAKAIKAIKAAVIAALGALGITNPIVLEMIKQLLGY